MYEKIAVGVVLALLGLLIWLIKRSITKADKIKEDKELAREKTLMDFMEKQSETNLVFMEVANTNSASLVAEVKELNKAVAGLDKQGEIALKALENTDKQLDRLETNLAVAFKKVDVIEHEATKALTMAEGLATDVERIQRNCNDKHRG